MAYALSESSVLQVLSGAYIVIFISKAGGVVQQALGTGTYIIQVALYLFTYITYRPVQLHCQYLLALKLADYLFRMVHAY